jgi:RNA polymerase sigma-70 factor (sigma-E family)
MTPGRRGDRVRYEFDEFVAGSARDLLRTAYLIVWDEPAAEDLVQECLFEVARRWPRVRTMEYPLAYARRILVNRALAGGRRRGRQRAELDGLGPLDGEELADEDAELAFGSVETISDLVDAVQTLAPLQRTVLGLRYFDDLSEAQVAEILGCSVGTVKSTTWRALARLRQTPARAAGALSRPFPHQ